MPLSIAESKRLAIYDEMSLQELGFLSEQNPDLALTVWETVWKTNRRPGTKWVIPDPESLMAKELPLHLTYEEIDVERWFLKGKFNPNSPDHIIKYMEAAGKTTRPSKHSKTGKPSTDEGSLSRLAKKDALFGYILKHRKLEKLRGTYVNSIMGLLDLSNRIHPQFPHNPSTWRLSSMEPNFQNIPSPSDEDGSGSLERQFRQAVVAKEGCLLVSGDFSGIEAVLTGWYAGDRDYMRLATLGIHSYLTSFKVGEPADLSWSDEKLSDHLAAIKRRYHDSEIYFALKKTVHLTNFGGSPAMMNLAAPDTFPTIAAAENMQNFYLSLCPKLAAWHKHLRVRAAKENCLGGLDHPYRFKHWFWDVTKWDAQEKRWVHGSDWNRVIAFYPQSTAAGILFDAVLDLTSKDSPNYIGDMYFGETPLRALIHDEILAEVQVEYLQEFVDRLRRSMQISRFDGFTPPGVTDTLPLVIGADIHVGPNWGEMESI